MTPEQFLHQLLSSQALNPKQETVLKSHKDEVTKYLRSEFGEAPVIKYAGSYEKGTLISECYDLDIVCYFPSTDNRSLKEIREDVSTHLQNKYLIQEKTSALRILTMKGILGPNYHVDVVPGRFIEGTKDVFLHVAYGDKERMMTNLKTHIDYIKNSGCIDVIRLTKLWAHRNDLSIRTFVLELFVIESLAGFRNKTDLKEAFLEVLRAFRDNFGKVQLVDPANKGNIVSQLIDSSAKTIIPQKADIGLKFVEGSSTLKEWQTIFGETTGTGIQDSVGPSVGQALPNATPRAFTPRANWSPIYDNGQR